jgi:hypothetical protein
MITAFVTAPPPTALPPMRAFVVAIEQDLLIGGLALLLALAAACIVTRVHARKSSRSARLRVLMGARGANVRRAA